MERHGDTEHADVGGGYHSLKLVLGGGKCPWCKWISPVANSPVGLHEHINAEHGDDVYKAFMLESPVPRVNLDQGTSASCTTPASSQLVTTENSGIPVFKENSNEDRTVSPIAYECLTSITQGKEARDEKGSFTCSICFKFLFRRSEFLLHLDGHELASNYFITLHQCNECGWSSTTKKNLKMHHKCIHKDKRECNYCYS